MMRSAHLSAIALATIPALLASLPPARAERPTMKDFMGVCVHFHFDGPTYAPVTSLVRNYHSLNWDLDVTEPYRDPPYPFALNRVNWQTLYGDWQQAGVEISAAINMSHGVTARDWLAPEEAAHRFGRTFARFFGPAGKGLVASVELGNEPGLDSYPDEEYTAIARAMARGLREGDPGLRIATAALTLGESDDYAKSIRCYEGWMDMVDVLNVHSYAMKGHWPDRRRTWPEDPGCDFLTRVRDLIQWRDEHAPDKQVWVTEFGWDAHRPEGAPETEGVPMDQRPSFVSRTQQAQFLLRAYLLLARLGADRAYLFWYRDEGPSAGMHNASGLISAGAKQPAFHALASFRERMNNFRFARVLTENPSGVYAYRLDDAEGRACLAVWTPTWDGEPRSCELDLRAAGLSDFRFVTGVEPALSEGGGCEVPVEVAGGLARMTATGTPRLLFFERRRPAARGVPAGGRLNTRVEVGP